MFTAPGAVFTNSGGTVTGGRGGDGGSAGVVGATPGAAGTGGIGVHFMDSGELHNNGLISGGDGGSSHGTGGNGGTGVFFANGGTLDNSGTIIGGGGTVSGGTAGAGGAGVVGSNLAIINSGAISGQLDGPGAVRANAITFTGGSNVLELQAGSVINGNVAGTGSDTFRLGGSTNGNFDVSGVGAAAQYQGFSTFEKTGASNWTLGGIGSQNWAISEGTLTGSTDSMGGDLTFATGAGVRDVVFAQATSGTYSGTISGDGSFTKSNGGVLTLSGVQGYTGGTTLSGGAIRMGAANALASSSGVQLIIGTWDLGGFDQTIKGLAGNAGTNIALGTATLTVDNTGSNSFGGTVSGSGGLTKTGAAILQLEGANTYSGATNVEHGLMLVASGGSLQNSSAINISNGAQFGVFAADALSPTAAVNLTGAGSEFQAITDQQIGSLAGAAGTRIWLNPGVTLTTGGNNTSTTFAGDIGYSGVGSLTKIGTGTFTLSGANSYTGATTVSGGSLIVNGSIAASSLTTVEAGGTLAGSGTVGNADIYGTLSAGNSPGMLTFAGDLTLNAGSTSVFELGAPGVAGGASNDLVTVTGNLALGGTLDAHVAAAGYYRLFNYGGTLSGSFASGTLTGTGGFTPLSPNNPDIRTNIVHQVNLAVLGTGQTMQFWDGGDPVADGTIDGGTGAWQSFATNWTNDTGSANGGWGDSVGVFAGSAGTVTVDGTQGFDTLQFSTDGYTLTGGSLALDPASGSAGTFNIDNGVTTTVGSIIVDGMGNTLKKVGGGQLTLSGANTYTGGTQLLGGVLSVSSDANLGATSGALTIDGGTLRVSGATFNSTERNIVLGPDGGGFDIADPGNVFTISQSVTGSGGLTKTGAGALMLSAANDYSGGTTVSQGFTFASVTGAYGTGPIRIDAISAGSANLGFINSASAGTAAIYVANSRSALFFNDSASAGSATIDNNGAIYFGFSSTADAATIVNNAGGRVDISGLTSSGIGIGSLSGDGDILLGSKVLTLGSLGTNETIGGVIQDGTAGTGGSLIKTGSGTLTLNGVNTFTGGTMVNAGKLVVGDSSHASATLGDVTLATGGILGGIGTIGNTMIGSGGTLAPGNSIGTINVAGSVAFGPGSVYEVEIDADGRSDKTVATGTATINGGTVKVVAGAGSYAPQTDYTILTANGGRTGTFAGITSNLAFLDPSLVYDANNVYLTMKRNDASFSSIGQTFNQKATGGGAESTGAGSPIYSAIADLSADQARAALDSLSGEIHASVKSALIEDSHFVRDAVNDRIRSAFGDATGTDMPLLAYGPDGARPASADSSATVAWGQVFGAWGSFDGDGNAAGMDSSTGGFLTGIDGAIAANIRLGLLAGYSHSSFDVDDRASSGSSDNYHLGLYGGGKWNALRLTGGIAYTWHDIETNRLVAFPGFSDSLTGNYSAGTFQAFGETGYKIDTGAVSFEPFANLAYVSLHTDGFREKGGAAALDVRSATTDATFTTLGVHVSSAFTFGGMKATASGTLGWRHAFGDTTPLASVAFADGSSFTVAGVPIAEDAAVLEAGLDFAISDSATLGVSYTGQFASQAHDHGAKANLSVRF
ncbi:autotransporter domain-containing protein [Mesorhizobium sp. CA13]|uniref:autotransporter domain-containing protein n=1 Tax=Mesorhizobium sp. CA13 TaxID=2876643 RepID=UPI0021E1D949|nr:autotransporter domain-containing protein [Mesorhizobium sp. CA13]